MKNLKQLLKDRKYLEAKVLILENLDSVEESVDGLLECIEELSQPVRGVMSGYIHNFVDNHIKNSDDWVNKNVKFDIVKERNPERSTIELLLSEKIRHDSRLAPNEMAVVEPYSEQDLKEASDMDTATGTELDVIGGKYGL